MAQDPCRAIGEAYAKMLDLDRDAAEGVSVSMMQARTPRDSIWNGIQGDSVRELAGGFAEEGVGDMWSNIAWLRNTGNDNAIKIAAYLNAMRFAKKINESLDVMQYLPFVNKLSKAEKSNWAEVREQRSHVPLDNGLFLPTGSKAAVPMNAKVEIAEAKMAEYFRDSAVAATERDILNGYQEHYLPHMRPTKLLDDPKYREKALVALEWQHAVLRTSREMGITPYDVKRADVKIQPIDSKFSEDNFDSYLTPQLTRIAPNLEKARVMDIPGYELDPVSILRRYAQSKAQRFAEHDVWGPRKTLHGEPELVTKMFGQLYKDFPNAADQARIDFIKQSAFGYTPNVQMPAIGRVLGDIQGLKMTMSSLLNSTQSLNSGMRTSFITMVKGYAALLSDREIAEGVGARDFTMMSGLVADNVLQDVGLYQSFSIGSTALRATGFTAIERFNRMHAAVSGALYTEKMYEKALEGGYWGKRAATRLRELGFDAEQIRDSGGLTFNHLLVGARRVVDETQFVTDYLELPRAAFLQGPWGRALLQFKNFTYQNSRLWSRELARRPGHALMFGTTIMAPVGMGVNYARVAIGEGIAGESNDFQEGLSPTELYFQGLASTGVASVASDTLWNIVAGIEAGRSSEQIAADMVIPPQMSTVIDAISVPMDIVRARYASAGRTVLRNLGGLGSAFSKRVFPRT